VLAHPEEVHPHPVRQLRLDDNVAEHTGLRQLAARRVHGYVAEGVEAQLDIRHGEVTSGRGAGFPARTLPYHFFVRPPTDSPVGSGVPSETEVLWSVKDGFEPSTNCGSPT
jgi:hypothetical protein